MAPRLGRGPDLPLNLPLAAAVIAISLRHIPESSSPGLSRGDWPGALFAALGLGGAAVGGTVGNATEHAMDEGVPKDDVVVYRELLKRRRSLVIVNVDSEELADRARAVMQQNGTEDVETFRKEIKDAA